MKITNIPHLYQIETTDDVPIRIPPIYDFNIIQDNTLVIPSTITRSTIDNYTEITIDDITTNNTYIAIAQPVKGLNGITPQTEINQALIATILTNTKQDLKYFTPLIRINQENQSDDVNTLQKLDPTILKTTVAKKTILDITNNTNDITAKWPRNTTDNAIITMTTNNENIPIYAEAQIIRKTDDQTIITKLQQNWIYNANTDKHTISFLYTAEDLLLIRTFYDNNTDISVRMRYANKIINGSIYWRPWTAPVELIVNTIPSKPIELRVAVRL